MIQLIRTTTDDTQFTTLVYKLEQELRERYGVIQDIYEPHNKVVNLNTVVVAYEDKIPVGCGCFKEYDPNTIEVKRMFVDADHRLKGVAKQVLKELENWAQELGYTHTILETGMRQPESIALYKKFGYEQILNYKPYMEMVESVCFGKSL